MNKIHINLTSYETEGLYHDKRFNVRAAVFEIIFKNRPAIYDIAFPEKVLSVRFDILLNYRQSLKKNETIS